MIRDQFANCKSVYCILFCSFCAVQRDSDALVRFALGEHPSFNLEVIVHGGDGSHGPNIATSRKRDAPWWRKLG